MDLNMIVLFREFRFEQRELYAGEENGESGTCVTMYPNVSSPAWPLSFIARSTPKSLLAEDEAALLSCYQLGGQAAVA